MEERRKGGRGEGEIKATIKHGPGTRSRQWSTGVNVEAESLVGRWSTLILYPTGQYSLPGKLSLQNGSLYLNTLPAI